MEDVRLKTSSFDTLTLTMDKKGMVELSIVRPFGEALSTTLSASELGILLTKIGNAQSISREREIEAKANRNLTFLKRRRT